MSSRDVVREIVEVVNIVRPLDAGEKEAIATYLRRLYGGQAIYISARAFETIRQRNAAIMADLAAGCRHGDIATKYCVSRRWVSELKARWQRGES